MIRILALLLVLATPALGQDDKAAEKLRDWRRLLDLSTRITELEVCTIVFALANDDSPRAQEIYAGHERIAVELIHGLDRARSQVFGSAQQVRDGAGVSLPGLAAGTDRRRHEQAGHQYDECRGLR